MKLCECGCGRPAPIATQTDRTRGAIKGQPYRFVCGHNSLTTHRATRDGKMTPEYSTWSSMRKRCLNPKSHAYGHYGGRGIRICPRWDDFTAFLSDMGPKPGPGFSVERIDNDADYSPENCIWATAQTQRRNQRNTKLNSEAVKVIRFVARPKAGKGVILARLYKVNNTTISAIIRGKIWREEV